MNRDDSHDRRRSRRWPDEPDLDAAIPVPGIDAEYRWIFERYPDARIVAQGLTARRGRCYETLEFELPGGERKRAVFLLTGWKVGIHGLFDFID